MSTGDPLDINLPLPPICSIPCNTATSKGTDGSVNIFFKYTEFFKLSYFNNFATSSVFTTLSPVSPILVSLETNTSAYVFKLTPCIVLPSGLLCCKSTFVVLVLASKFTKVFKLDCISPLNILLTG